MRIACTVVAMLMTVALLGCSRPDPVLSYPPSNYTRAQLTGEVGETGEFKFTPPPVFQAKITDLVDAKFPHPTAIAADAELPHGQIKKGQDLYRLHCLHCHGLAGAGDGPTGPFVVPRARDFRRGVFKWKSTAKNAKPTRDDLRRVLTEGVFGTSMPAFVLQTPEEIEALVDYVIYLSQRGEFERNLLYAYSEEGPTVEELEESGDTIDEETTQEILEVLTETADESVEELRDRWASAEEQVVEPEAVDLPAPGSEEFEKSVARGKEIYLGSAAACSKCHAPDGRADPKVTQLRPEEVRDVWGFPNLPRDLTLGLFRGGRRPVDLYRRIDQGIEGSSMPGLGQNPKVSKQDYWDLVSFLRALPARPELLTPGEAPPPEHAAARLGGNASAAGQ